MRSKWEGVPINLVPADERDCERTRREDEAEKKKPESAGKGKTVHEERQAVVDRSSIDVITDMNEPSIFSRGVHSGMVKRPKHVDENVVFAPAGMVGVRKELPMPIIQSKRESEKIERLRVELCAARKQIELDEQDKDALRETIEEQKKKIADLESRPIVTDEMQLKLLKYDQSLKKGREREKRFIERHSQE